MITSFRHAGLRKLFEKGERKHIRQEHVDKIRRILARLAEASEPKHMDLPGYRLHLLKGQYQGFWSITVNGNWRIIFRMKNGEALDLDYLDYH